MERWGAWDFETIESIPALEDDQQYQTYENLVFEDERIKALQKEFETTNKDKDGNLKRMFR
jgi:hypothetical protein